jgi:hypothetical protein
MSQKPPENLSSKQQYSVEEHMFSQLVILNKRVFYLNIVVTVLAVAFLLAAMIFGYLLFLAPAPPAMME